MTKQQAKAARSTLIFVAFTFVAFMLLMHVKISGDARASQIRWSETIGTVTEISPWLHQGGYQTATASFTYKDDNSIENGRVEVFSGPTGQFWQEGHQLKVWYDDSGEVRTTSPYTEYALAMIGLFFLGSLVAILTGIFIFVGRVLWMEFRKGVDEHV